MVAITATSYATPSAQAYQSQARLEQARREADQAESYAKQLRAQADDAEQQAQTEQGKVTTLSAQVAQTDSTYTRQKSNTATAAAVTQAQDVLVPVASVANNKFSFPANPLKSYASSTAIGQLLGQRSGRFVNVTA
jgi:TolA-binding protein